MDKASVKGLAFLANNEVLHVSAPDLCWIIFCMETANKFPAFSVRPGFVSEKGENFRLRFVIVVDEMIYTYSVSSYMVVEHKLEENSFILRMESHSKREFCRLAIDVLEPYAYSEDKPQRHFIMPDIVEGMLKGTEIMQEEYIACVLAASLGLDDVVTHYAEEVLKKEITQCLHKQKIYGCFEVPPADVALLLPALRKVTTSIDPGFLRQLGDFQEATAVFVCSDITLEPLEKSLLFFAEAKEVTAYMTRRSINFYLRVGPWFFCLQNLKSRERYDMDSLIEELLHTTIKRKKGGDL